MINNVSNKVVVSIFLLVLCNGVQAQGKRFLKLEDAAVAMAQAWQRGDKAKPIMSDDGKIIFAYGQSMPKLTCSPTRACDVEMQPGEKVVDVILGDRVRWTWSPSTSVEKGKTIQHVVIQPRDNAVESNAIITTDHRTYHIKLYAPKEEGVYLNRVGFYYPDELVESWNARANVKEVAVKQEDDLRVTEESSSPDELDFDYQISGNADFKPLRVFNNGVKVYIQLPASVLQSGEAPTLALIDDEGKENVVNLHTRGQFYIVDRLFTSAKLIVGKEKVTIRWRKKAGWTWDGWGSGS
ncbi:P-type conjugative transfer protein TrbG [Glaciimonas sp. GG7]